MLYRAFSSRSKVNMDTLTVSSPANGSSEVAGLFIGNPGQRLAMSEVTRESLDNFWELVDEILNALLFVLIGLEVLVLTFQRDLFFAGLLAIPAILLVRWVSVFLPVLVLRRWREFSKGTVGVMTWVGIRGGISVALALSLPAGREREIVLAVTYTVVIFSISSGLIPRRLRRIRFGCEQVHYSGSSRRGSTKPL